MGLISPGILLRVVRICAKAEAASDGIPEKRVIIAATIVFAILIPRAKLRHVDRIY